MNSGMRFVKRQFLKVKHITSGTKITHALLVLAKLPTQTLTKACKITLLNVNLPSAWLSLIG